MTARRKTFERGEVRPLRAVVSEGVNEHGTQTETLECGHVVHRKQDAFGHTNAYRRRCRHCPPVPSRRIRKRSRP